jgi:hypothetical protein
VSESEETTRDCLGECHRGGINKAGYWTTMVGNYVIVHEDECEGTVKE